MGVAAGEVPESVVGWLAAAFAGEDPAPLLDAAACELGAPLGLAAPGGRPLGQAPADADGRRAQAIAEAAARSGVAAPAGWTVVTIIRGSRRLGHLAVSVRATLVAPRQLQLLAALLGEQLERGELKRARTRGIVRRIVREIDGRTAELRRDAEDAGLALADAYRAAFLCWRKVPPRDEVAEAIEREAREQGRPVLTAPVQRGVVLLHPGDAAAAHACFTAVAARARELAPSSGAQVLEGEAPIELRGLRTHVAELMALARLCPASPDQGPVVPAGRFALDRLLWHVAGRPEAAAFVDEQLRDLVAWDAAHRGDLVRVLEAALAHPRHDRAAQQCFMHRNTFRHHLRQAVDVLGRDIDDPDVRLALHVALRLRRVLRGSDAPPAPVTRAAAQTARAR